MVEERAVLSNTEYFNFVISVNVVPFFHLKNLFRIQFLRSEIIFQIVPKKSTVPLHEKFLPGKTLPLRNPSMENLLLLPPPPPSTTTDICLGSDQ